MIIRPYCPGFRWRAIVHRPGVSPRAIVHRPYRPDQVYALKGQINPAQGKAKRHPGLRGAKRKFPALCKPSPTLPQQDWRRLAGRGTADAVIRPRVPLRPGGVALPWAGLICPSGAHRAFPFIRENIRPNHPRGFAGGLSSTGPGFRPGLSSTGPTARIDGTRWRPERSLDDSPGRNPGRAKPWADQTTEHVAVRWSYCMRANAPISSYGYQPYGLDGSAHIA